MHLRRIIAAILLACSIIPAVALVAFAEDEAPTVDILEVSGLIDPPIARYLTESIQDAQARHAALVVLHVDSLGFLKVSDDQLLPPLVRFVRDATVPIAVQIGPRGARAGAGIVALLAAAHIASTGPSTRLTIDASFDLETDAPGGMPIFQLQALEELAELRGRDLQLSIEGDPPRSGPAGPSSSYSANEALRAGLVDYVTPSIDELLTLIDGTVETVAGREVTIDVPRDLATIRFLQPGPLRRALHSLATPALAYLLLVGAIMLFVFEASQPGFGVAGGTAISLGFAAIYGFTVLPATWWGMLLLVGGSLLLWLDVIRDELLVPTWLGIVAFTAGSVFLLPRTNEATTLPIWITLFGSAMAFIFFAPVMTLVKRQRRPIATAMKRQLVGEGGEVRSMLDPEGYVMVGGELWRARLAVGGRLRVGERVTVTGVDGSVLLVDGSDTSAN